MELHNDRSTSYKKRRVFYKKISVHTDKCVDDFYRSFKLSEVDRTPKLKQYEDLYRENLELRERISKLESERKRPEKENQLETVESDKKMKKRVKIVNYIKSHLRNAPDVERVISKRFKSFDTFLDRINHNDGNARKICLQLVYDLISKDISDNGKEDKGILFHSLKTQTDRLEKLRKEISQTVYSSKQLLGSPVSNNFDNLVANEKPSEINYF